MHLKTDLPCRVFYLQQESLVYLFSILSVLLYLSCDVVIQHLASSSWFLDTGAKCIVHSYFLILEVYSNYMAVFLCMEGHQLTKMDLSILAGEFPFENLEAKNVEDHIISLYVKETAA